MPLERPPEHGPNFESMMTAIDSKLISDGIDIPSRPMQAVAEISKKYNISIPLGGNQNNMPPDIRINAALSDSIYQWYKDNYSDRLNVNQCPGQMVILIDGDLYAIRVPRTYGSVNFVLGRDWISSPSISRGPVICNVAQLVEEMTPARLARLSDSALEAIWKAFNVAVPAAYTLENTNHKLMLIARGDIDIAVSSLMAQINRYGESKWASLQATEKVLKAAIDLAGANFKFTHNLAELCNVLAKTGLTFDARFQVSMIQCRPSIRYGDDPCTREDALAAHHSSLEMVNILREAGAKFSLGIGGSRSAG